MGIHDDNTEDNISLRTVDQLTGKKILRSSGMMNEQSIYIQWNGEYE